jgi:hypothetical protein
MPWAYRLRFWPLEAALNMNQKRISRLPYFLLMGLIVYLAVIGG